MHSRHRHLRRALLTACAIVVAQLGTNSAHAASIPTPTDLLTSPGVVSASGGAGTFRNTFTWTEPEAITATVSAPGKTAGVTDTSACMDTDPCGFWGGGGSPSPANMASAFTPSSITGADGVSWGYRGSKCAGKGPGGTDLYPTTSDPVVSCGKVDSITITFDKPVSNVVFHMHNLGGNSGKSGYDQTFFSEWTLTSGQDITMLSGASTTNITLDGNTIKNKNTPQSLQAKVATGSAPFADGANGTGSGSFQIVGYNYTSITFDVSLKYALVNDTGGGSGSAFDSNIPEYVMIQMSMYKTAFEAPADDSGGSGGSGDTQDRLTQSGVDASGLWLAAVAVIVGAVTVPRRRRRRA